MKKQIEEQEQIPVEQQLLTYHGKALNDDDTIAEYAIPNEAIVALLSIDKSFGIGVGHHDYDNDLSLLLSNGLKLRSFGDSLHKVELSGHKISSLACTSDCSLCNDDCDSCNT